MVGLPGSNSGYYRAAENAWRCLALCVSSFFARSGETSPALTKTTSDEPPVRSMDGHEADLFYGKLG